MFAAVISWRLRDGCCNFLQGRAKCAGTVVRWIPIALKITHRKMALDPKITMQHFGTLLLCQNHLAEVVRSKPRRPVYRGKRHIPPFLGLFGPIRVPYFKGLNCWFNPL